MEKGSKSIVIGSAAAAVIVIVIVFSMFYAGMISGQSPSANPQKTSQNGTAIGSNSYPPRMVIFALKNDQDNSEGTISYDSNNTNPIILERNQHIRFESPDYRLPDSLRVIAKDSGGNIHILLKSY